MEKPKELFHYTSIENLALILKSQKIRFNTLPFVDDPYESITQEDFTVKKYYLISCWSDSIEENIALWSQYGNQMKGCIISLPVEMFSDHGMGNIYNEELKPDEKIIVLKENRKAKITTAMKDLIEVEYLDSPRNTRFFNEKDGETYIENYLPIKEKHKSWSFQREWRFILYQSPKPKNKKLNAFFGDELDIKYKDTNSFPFDYFDLKISNSAFRKMKIIMGPKCSNADYIITESLVEKYNKSADISKSKIVLKGGVHMSSAGFLNGKHYSSYTEEITELKRNKEYEELETLLLKIVSATKEEDRISKMGVAPAYFEELAKLYRNLKRKDDEIAILEEFAKQRHARGRKPKILLDRLEKLKSPE